MNHVCRVIHADEIHRKGIKGRGVTATVMDSGICGHPDYADRVVCFRDFVGHRSGFYDDASHGSHVTGILGGNGALSGGKYCGVAPECDLIHLKVLNGEGTGKTEDAIQAMDWVIRNKDKFNIRVLNISAGAPEDASQEDGRQLLKWVEKVWDAGVVVVAAAGNRGPGRGSITIPGTCAKVITVGFCDEERRGRGGRYYSGRGPTSDCVCKPEITAPGCRVTSCSNLRSPGRPYCTKSGSSMATPVVSGAVCLLLSVQPWLTNVEVKMRLREAAEDLGLPREQQGWGRINLRRLLGTEDFL